MIGVLASILAGIWLREYTLFLAPLVYLVALKNRDLGLLSYLVYAIYTANRVVVGDIYSYPFLINGLLFALSALLLLDDVLLRKTRLEKVDLITLLLILSGLLLPEGLVAGALLHFLKLRPDWKVGTVVLGAIATFALFREQISGLGASGSSVILGGFTLLAIAAAFLMRDLKGVEMFKQHRNR
ncbi:MAG: hypothetical protein PWQ79_2302 [Thermococcaceae archaeon]|nr:hypothetical protein [Thermococcaceae archaeon]MDK2915387.1 hypothetical protein [Thermococcaceae archaeon]